MPQVSDFTALLSGYTWAGYEPDAAAPAFVTYSFDTQAAGYLEDGDYFSQAFIGSFAAFNEAEKNAARNALNQWASASGVVFLEVAPGQGDIRFGTYDFDRDPNTAGFDGYGYFPYTLVESDLVFRDDIGGDLFFRKGTADDVYLLLHEIGHALGFKHPFEGDVTLLPGFDNHSYTVMSYTGNYPNRLGPFDLDAVRDVYGGPGNDGGNLTSWSWDDQQKLLRQTGTGGDDSILGVTVRDKIDGGGGSDIIAGFQGRDQLGGGKGADRVFGGDGADTLRGGGGLDVLDGENGADLYEFVAKAGGTDTLPWFSGRDGDHDVLRFAAAAFGDLGRNTSGTGPLLGRHFQSSTASQAAAEDVRFIYDNDSGALRYDADGSLNGADAILIARLSNLPALSASDIVIF